MTGSGFGIHELPYGVVTVGTDPRRWIGVAYGDGVLDAGALARAPGSGGSPYVGVLSEPSLDGLLAAGPGVWAGVRGWLAERLAAGVPGLVPIADVTTHLAWTVADYVDFYASEAHATNVGRIFRPGAEPLPPQWKRLPIGYHGRAGTVVASGTDIRRPRGLRLLPGAAVGTEPAYGASLRLDVEAEVGFVVGAGSTHGIPVAAGDVASHVFGVVLLNDWSARDVQSYEYVPLGPFLGKSFATSVSGWVLPLAALSAARVAGPQQVPAVADYLRVAGPWGLDLSLRVEWNGGVVARPPFAGMYWNVAQLLAHVTANGASVRPGDLLGSGTVSGDEPGERGSFLELSWGGTEPVTLADGSTRTFLADGDTVVLRATAPGPDGGTVALGECRGTILPALPPTLAGGRS